MNKAKHFTFKTKAKVKVVLAVIDARTVALKTPILVSIRNLYMIY